MIDLHAHVVLESALGAAGPLGPELDEGDPASGRPPSFRVGDYQLVGVDYRGTPFMDLDARLAAMDAAGIDLQVLSPNPLTFFAGVDPEPATAFSRRHNDEMAALVSEAPGRLAGLAQLPVQDPAGAAGELRRAVDGLGLLGAYLPTDMGRPLDDPALDILWSACTDLDVPVFLHPAPDGVSGPRRDERLARFDGDLWLGFLYEETLAVATLVLGGVLDRHPDLDVCVSHGGGATSWLLDRLEHAARTRPWGAGRLAGPGEVTEQIRRIWWDAHVGGPRALAALTAAMGTHRIVAGTNLAGWDQGLDPSHGDAELATTFDANARRLLRLGERPGQRATVTAG
jgi:aminocarboxymuconate-semialdehyde decarboxylase